MVSKAILLRLPAELETLVNDEIAAMDEGTKCSPQAVILTRLAASYGIKLQLPKRGSQPQYDHAKIRQMSAKGKTAAQIAEKTGMSINRVYEVLNAPPGNSSASP